jgi:hypothetical protein
MSDEKILSVDEDGFVIEVDASEFEEDPVKLLRLEESIEKVMELAREVTKRHDSEFNDYNIEALENSVESVDEPVYVTVPVVNDEAETRNQYLREVREKASKEVEKNKIKLNPHTKAHLDKHFKQFNGSCQSGINRTGVSYERNVVATEIAVDENKKHRQEALQNINAITKALLKQLEAPPPPPVKKTWKEKVQDKVAFIKTRAENKKRDIFFSIVKHAQKVLSVKD